jgi:mono/diheme cytochrome c family protein
MIKRKLILFGLFGLMLFIACAPALYLPNAEVARVKNKPLEGLNAGRSLYIDHCGSCHQLYLPSRFADSSWRRSVDKMQSRARINDDQKHLIMDYILSGK